MKICANTLLYLEEPLTSSLQKLVGKADDHLRLDRGTVDFGPVIQAMRKIGFAGHASIEIYAPVGEREAALQMSRRILEQFCDNRAPAQTVSQCISDSEH